MSSQLEVIYRDLEKEHQRVMKMIDRLRSHDSMIGLLPLLDQLRTLLIVHFAREQLPDGFYEALGERARDRREEIRILTNDHAAILSTLNALIGDAKTADADSEADVLERVTRLGQALHDHEHKEHRFATDVLGKKADQHR